MEVIDINAIREVASRSNATGRSATNDTVIALCNEVERLQHINGNPLSMLGIDQLRDENKELRQEVERLNKDAARYVRLKEKMKGPVPVVRVQICKRGYSVIYSEKLDAAIDATMETKCLNQ